jgi:hypothetical protein
MENKMIKCSICSCNINEFDVKYHTADMKHVFCDAYCSFEWHMKEKNDGTNKREHKDSP